VGYLIHRYTAVLPWRNVPARACLLFSRPVGLWTRDDDRRGVGYIGGRHGPNVDLNSSALAETNLFTAVEGLDPPPSLQSRRAVLNVLPHAPFSLYVRTQGVMFLPFIKLSGSEGAQCHVF